LMQTGDAVTSSMRTNLAMSAGGITDVHVENLHVYNSRFGIRLKTGPGRGGFVKNIVISNMTMKNVQISFDFTGSYSGHPDGGYDPNALPDIYRLSLKDIVGDNIMIAGSIEGIQEAPFRDICLSNIYLNVTSESPWNCSNVNGFSESVSPQPCAELQSPIPNDSSICPSYFTSSGEYL